MNTAVITGAGRGLGRLIAQELAAKGFSVLVTDIDELAVADTAKRIGESAWFMHQDVREPGSHQRVAEAAQERGPLSVWVNNAGVLHTGDFWDMGEQEIRREVDVNLYGVIWGAQAAARVMERGHIINIASIAALVASPGLAVYSATKHAVLGFSLALHGELQGAGRDIRVSAVCPDAIDTDMVRGVAHQETANILFSAPKLLKPEDIAKKTAALVEKPKLVAIYPRYRGVLAHAFRSFPGTGLRLLGHFRKLGSRNRARHQ